MELLECHTQQKNHENGILSNHQTGIATRNANAVQGINTYFETPWSQKNDWQINTESE